MTPPLNSSPQPSLTTPISPAVLPQRPHDTVTPQPPPTSPPPEGLWLADLRRVAQTRLSWLWDGFLAPGNVTLLTSQWKSGKTTLLAILLAKLKAGGTLAGLPLAAGKAAVLSEESHAQWLRRAEALGIGDHVCWFCRPFRAKPRPDEWLALVDHLADLHARHHLSLVAIDPLASFLPGHGENNADLMLEFLLSLQRLTSLNLAVLLLHHPPKHAAADGLAARGSGALSGYADILIEMKWHSRPSEDNRRRRLQAFSRYDATPRQLVIELNADGTDYLARGDFQEDEFTHHWLVLRAVLEAAPKKLTRSQIARRWPPGNEPLTDITLWRWLDRAVTRGLLRQEGTGQKNDPYRYWLPGQEEVWKTPAWVKELEALNAQLAAFADPPTDPPLAPPSQAQELPNTSL